MDKLNDYIDTHFESNAAFAKHAGFKSEMTVTRLRNGDIPNKKAKKASAIMKVFKATKGEITPNDFYGVE